MHPSIESKLAALEIRKNDRRKKGVILIIISCIPIIYLLMAYFNVISAPQIILPLIDVIIMLPLMILGLGVILILNPYSTTDRAFCEVIDAINMLQKSTQNELLRKHAFKKIKKAASILQPLERGKSRWYIDTRKEEQKFIRNLNTLVAPAVLDGNLEPGFLTEIALLFTDTNILGIKKMNEVLERNFEYKEAFDKSMMDNILNYYDTKIGRIMASFIMGYFIILLCTFIFSLITQQNPTIFIKERPEIILIGGATISVGLMQILKMP